MHGRNELAGILPAGSLQVKTWQSASAWRTIGPAFHGLPSREMARVKLNQSPHGADGRPFPGSFRGLSPQW